MSCVDESGECLDARRDYDWAEYERGMVEGRIAERKRVQKGMAGLTGVGAGLALIGGPLGWAVGFGLGVGGAINVYLAQQDVERLLADCEAIRRRMFDAYQRAERSCSDPGCVPPRGWSEPCS